MSPTHPQEEDYLPICLILVPFLLLPSSFNPDPLLDFLLSPLGPEISTTVLASLMEPPQLIEPFCVRQKQAFLPPDKRSSMAHNL